MPVNKPYHHPSVPPAYCERDRQPKVNLSIYLPQTVERVPVEMDLLYLDSPWLRIPSEHYQMLLTVIVLWRKGPELGCRRVDNVGFGDGTSSLSRMSQAETIRAGLPP